MVLVEPESDGPAKAEIKDPWAQRSIKMKCGSCMQYVDYRCRRHAPTMGGYPAVFPDTDWCGDHKLDKERMRGI